MNHDGANSLPMREVPANLEAELGLIGSCVLNPAAIDDAVMFVTEGDFWRDAHGALWKALVALRDAGRQVNYITLADHLGARLEAIGGLELLHSIDLATPHGANGRYFAQIVKAKATVRRLIEASNETLRDCYANEHTSEDIVARAESRVFAIAERQATGDTIGATELIGTTMTEILGREQGAIRGLMTGFDDLDYLTDGFKPQDFVVVAARPSMGKTAFAVAVAIHAATSGRPVLFSSLEMSKESLGERMLSAASGVMADKLKRSWTLSDGDRHKLAEACDWLGSASLKIDDRPIRTVSQIAANARRIKSRDGLGLVVIDYMSLIDGQRQKGENRQEEVARISRRLKAMARELNCPVLCLHQLNRQSENRDGHRPRLADLRESGQIEQDADQVLLLHRPEYYDPNDQPGIAEVIVAKNRNGPTGAARLAFHRNCTRFESLTTDATNGSY